MDLGTCNYTRNPRHSTSLPMVATWVTIWTLANFAIWCKMDLQVRFSDQQQSCPLAQAVSHRCGACSVNREMRKAPGEFPLTVLVDAHAAKRRQLCNSAQLSGPGSGLNLIALPLGTSVRRLHGLVLPEICRILCSRPRFSPMSSKILRVSLPDEPL